jgi:hypothetical protein
MIDLTRSARMRVRPLVGIAAVLMATAACDWMQKKDPPGAKSEKQLAAERNEQIRKACASEATYGRLKELVFDEAARIRNSDPRNLDPLAASSVVRMEEPLVKSRDEDLNVTVCTGRFFLELPPGAENAFDGKRRLSAEVEYAAQAAADGSGLVYRMDGAEPIIYRLASFGMAGRPMPRMVAMPQPSAPPAVPAEPVLVDAAPKHQPAVPPPLPKSEDKARRQAAAASETGARPSFNCRYARTASEKKVCASPALAAKDRAMASLYYDLMARADPALRAHLRRSRDAFLVRRERCGSEECIAAAYDSRRAEIRDIAGGD